MSNNFLKTQRPNPTSTNKAKRYHNLGTQSFYAQSYTSSIRDISRKVAKLEELFASLIEMLQSLQADEKKMDQERDEDEMDWQFEETVLSATGRCRILRAKRRVNGME